MAEALATSKVNPFGNLIGSVGRFGQSQDEFNHAADDGQFFAVEEERHGERAGVISWTTGRDDAKAIGHHQSVAEMTGRGQKNARRKRIRRRWSG